VNRVHPSAALQRQPDAQSDQHDSGREQALAKRRLAGDGKPRATFRTTSAVAAPGVIESSAATGTNVSSVCTIPSS